MLVPPEAFSVLVEPSNGTAHLRLSGRFDVTHNPHRALCLDCPARERLCSHATADQMREEPEPPVEPRGAKEEGEPAKQDDGEPQLSLREGG